MGNFSKNIHSLFKEGEKYADQAVKDFDQETIHKMRVAFKKIDALFNLLLFFSGGNLKAEDLTKAKATFKMAGKVRELQLMSHRAESVTSTDEESRMVVLEHLKKKEKKARKMLEHYFDKWGKKEIHDLKEMMLQAAEQIGDINLSAYFEDISEHIALIENKTDRSQKELHQFRKWVKELKYNLHFANEEERKRIETLFPPSRFELLEQLVGEWHDEVIFQSRIKKREGQLLAHASDMLELNHLRNFFRDLETQSEEIVQQDLSKIAQLMKKNNSTKEATNVVL